MFAQQPRANIPVVVSGEPFRPFHRGGRARDGGVPPLERHSERFLSVFMASGGEGRNVSPALAQAKVSSSG